MSRNNVFKLSGNIALGSQDNYPGNDLDNIKNSLKLLKAKQGQRTSNIQPEQNYGYSGSSGSYSSNLPTRNEPIGRNQGTYDSRNQPNFYKEQNQYKDSLTQMDNYNKHASNYDKSNRKIQSNKRVPDYQQYNYQEKNIQQRSNIRQPVNSNNRNYEQSYSNTQNYQNQQYSASQNYPSNQNYDPSAQQKKLPPKKPQGYELSQKKGNGYEERNIKEINRQNRVDIKEYDPSDFVECSEGCGRKFNPDSISKHQNICKKVFQKKRKEFNIQDKRITDKEQKKFMKKGQIVDKKIEEAKAKEKMPKWKMESLQLRAGLKQVNGQVPQSKEQRQAVEAAKNLGMVKCPTCSRSFNEKAAEKHLPFCEAQSRKNQFKRK